MTTQILDFSEIDLTGGLRWNGEVIGAAHYNGERLWPFGVDLLYTGGIGGASYLPDLGDVYGASALAAFGDGVSAVLDEKNGTPVLGPELVSNGNFSNGSTGWVHASAVSVADGAAIFTSAVGGDGLSQTVTVPAGTFRCSFTVSGATGGGLNFRLRTAGGTIHASFVFNVAVNQTYSFVLSTTSASNRLEIVSPGGAGSPTSLTIDNISVREVPGILAGQPSISFRPLLGRAPKERRNLLVNTDALATQGRVVTNVAHTLSFKGTGSIARSGASTGTLAGTGANDRVSVTFTPSAGTQTLTVTGSVTEAQLEVGSAVTPYQRVGVATDITEEGVPSYPFIRLDLSDDRLHTVLPQAVSGDVVIAGRNGSVIAPHSYAANTTFQLGSTSYTGGTPGILRAIGDVVGWSILGKTLTAAERERLMRFYKRRGAKGLLVPGGPELRTAAATLNGLWTESGGIVTASGSAGPTDNVTFGLSSPTVAGRFYEVVAPNNMPASGFYLDFGTGTGSQVGALSALTERIILTCTAPGSIIRVGRWVGTPTGTIGPISVRELRAEEDW